MNNNESFDSFTQEEIKKYSEEAKKRWGETAAYKQSQQRLKRITKEGFEHIQKEGEALMVEVAAHMDEGVKSQKVQDLIRKHFNNLRHFYEPNLELYRGLAEAYTADKHFSAFFEKYGKGLSRFMHDAMITYCEREKVRA